MSRDALTEYLYCDQRRLDHYFEQISEPVAYDKVPTWKAGLSLIGPTAEGTQARQARPFTLHEKVQKLISYLRSAHLLKLGRLTAPNMETEQPFRVEEMSARRAILPKRQDVPDFPGMRLWVSVEPDSSVVARAMPYRSGVGALFLLEDFQRDDETFLTLHTGYSWLTLLADVVDSRALYAFHLNETSGLSRLVSGLDPRFANDPIEALSRLGATFGPERRMAAFYRVRAACEADEQEGRVTTVGYPIVVTAPGGVLSGMTLPPKAPSALE